jgi:hypothetical protein
MSTSLSSHSRRARLASLAPHSRVALRARFADPV